MTITGNSLPLLIDKGNADLDYSCSVNGGPTHVIGAIRLKGDQSHLAMNASGIEVNAQMPRILPLLNPIFHVSQRGTVEGKANLDVDADWDGPLLVNQEADVAGTADFIQAVNQNLSAEGTFSADDLLIKNSPLVAELLDELVSTTNRRQLGRIEPTRFKLTDGVVAYENMVVYLGGARFVFSGSISTDETMKMRVEAPLPVRFFEHDESLAKYLDPTIVIPLTGTISKPKLDVKEAIKVAFAIAVEKAAKNVIKDEVLKQGLDLFEEMFKRSR